VEILAVRLLQNVLIYSPDSTNTYGLRKTEFDGSGEVEGLKVVKS